MTSPNDPILTAAEMRAPEPFEAACQAAWLHSEAATRAGPAFTATELAGKVADAYAACL